MGIKVENKKEGEIDNQVLGIENINAEIKARPVLKIDWHLYEEYLVDADIPDDQKKALIEALWSIMVSFVDLGFGLAPEQQALADRVQTNSDVTAPSSGKKTKRKIHEDVG